MILGVSYVRFGLLACMFTAFVTVYAPETAALLTSSQTGMLISGIAVVVSLLLPVTALILIQENKAAVVAT